MVEFKFKYPRKIFRNVEECADLTFVSSSKCEIFQCRMIGGMIKYLIICPKKALKKPKGFSETVLFYYKFSTHMEKDKELVR